MNSKTPKPCWLLRSGLAGIAFLLLGCQASPIPPPELAAAPPPPELDADTITLPDSEQPILSEEPDLSATAQPKPSRLPQRTFLPGLKTPRAPVAAGPEPRETSADETEVPFENELQKQRKRIYLGLEREQREQEPVDNVVNLQF